MKRLSVFLLVWAMALPTFALKSVNGKRVPTSTDWSSHGKSPKFDAMDTLFTSLANILPNEGTVSYGINVDSIRGNPDVDSLHNVDLLRYSKSGKGIVAGVLKTLKITIGHPGETTTDTAFASAANTTEQTLKLPAQVPAKARILDVMLICTQAVAGTGITEFVADIGDGAGTAEYATSASINGANELISSAVAGVPYVAVSASATDIYVNGTPTGGNWSAMTGGEWTVYITYIDNGSM